MTLRQQGWYPFVGGLVIAAATYFVLRDVGESKVSALMGHGINVAAIAVGFIATAKSILVSIERTRIVELIRDAGYYDLLLDYMWAAIKLWFAVAFVSGAVVLALGELPASGSRLVLSVWILLVVWAALAVYRVIRMLADVLRRASAG